jgi:hypothetical protein
MSKAPLSVMVIARLSGPSARLNQRPRQFNQHPEFFRCLLTQSVFAGGAGKNYRRTFTHPKCTIAERFGPAMDVARRMQDKHDPDRIFEPELWKSINNPEYALYPRCALYKDCYCQADEHCPEQHR